MHRVDKLIEQRVMSRLKHMIEASKKRPAGDWSDIANGAGGSIYNRRTPARRKIDPQSMESVQAEAASKWKSMNNEDRMSFMASMMDGFSRIDHEYMSLYRWSELVDFLGGEDSREVADLCRNLRTWV
jgi:hypothetical protein